MGDLAYVTLNKMHEVNAYLKIASAPQGLEALDLTSGEVESLLLIRYGNGDTYILGPNKNKNGFSSISGHSSMEQNEHALTVDEVANRIIRYIYSEATQNRQISELRAIIPAEYESQLIKVAQALRFTSRKIMKDSTCLIP